MPVDFDQYCQLNMLDRMLHDDFESAHGWAEMWGNEIDRRTRNPASHPDYIDYEPWKPSED